MNSRISEKAVKWVEIMDRNKSEGVTTPWWEELKKCAEGNVVPSRAEGWNHPVASEQKLRLLNLIHRLINLLLQSSSPCPRQPQIHFRLFRTYTQDRSTCHHGWTPRTFVVHSLFNAAPHRSRTQCMCTPHKDANLKGLSFNHVRTESLYNAVKKQHGNSHLLKLALPSPPPSGVPSAAILPRLPNIPENSGPDTPQLQAQAESFDIKMIETDSESTAKFVRELVVESLIPWMGRCILEWNEAVSRLFCAPQPQNLTKPVPLVSIHLLGDCPHDCSLPLGGCSVQGQFRTPLPKAQFHCRPTAIRPRQVLWPPYPSTSPHLLSNGGSRNLRPSLATTNLLFPSGRSLERKGKVVL